MYVKPVMKYGVTEREKRIIESNELHNKIYNDDKQVP